MMYDMFTRKLAIELKNNMGKEYQIILTKEPFQNGDPEDVLKIISQEYGFVQTCRLKGLYLQSVDSHIPINVVAQTMEKGFFSVMFSHLLKAHPEQIFQPSRIIYRLENYENNKEKIEARPHIRYLDLAITFYLVAEISETRILCFPIFYNMGSKITMDKKKLYHYAEINTRKYLKREVISSSSFDFSSEWNDGLSGEPDPLPEELKEVQRMISELSSLQKEFYVMSNQFKSNGATTLLYPDSLKSLANEWQSDLILSICSVHDVIVEAYREKEQLERIASYTEDAKDNLVPENEFLSDHVYLYSRENDRLEIIA